MLSMKHSDQILMKIPQIFIMGKTKENEQVEEGVFNEMAPSYDQVLFQCLFEVSR